MRPGRRPSSVDSRHTRSAGRCEGAGVLLRCGASGLAAGSAPGRAGAGVCASARRTHRATTRNATMRDWGRGIRRPTAVETPLMLSQPLSARQHVVDGFYAHPHLSTQCRQAARAAEQSEDRAGGGNPTRSGGNPRKDHDGRHQSVLAERHTRGSIRARLEGVALFRCATCCSWPSCPSGRREPPGGAKKEFRGFIAKHAQTGQSELDEPLEDDTAVPSLARGVRCKGKERSTSTPVTCTGAKMRRMLNDHLIGNDATVRFVAEPDAADGLCGSC